MRINFIGNFQKGFVGESADEIHLCDELEALGHRVQRVPRDIWKAFVDGHRNPDWENHLPKKPAKIGILCKWHHFNKASYIQKLRKVSGAPVLYWIWDFMWDETSKDFVSWHKVMAKEADILLTNEGGLIPAYLNRDINAYYFPFDVSSKEFDRVEVDEKIYDVVFLGSHIGKGDRVEWLKKINEKVPVKIWSWNWEKWKEDGFEAQPAVYGHQFASIISQSKIVLGFNVNDHCWGYWSNRVGKVLTVGGFLLYRYTPGMELFLRDGAEYFSTPAEAIAKIEYYLEHENEREKIAQRGYEIGRDRFTSAARIKELMIFIERYLELNK